MQTFPPTLIWRHRRENLKKCSLHGLEQREDFKFFSYPNQSLPDLSRYLILSVDAPELSASDADKGLLILDGTWRYACRMFEQLPNRESLPQRSIPKEFRTAYPRRQEDCPDPDQGLASIEAIFIAYKILNRSTLDLLKNYYWKEQFYKINNFKE